MAQRVPFFNKTPSWALAKLLNVAQLKVSKHFSCGTSFCKFLQSVEPASEQNDLPTMNLKLIYNSGFPFCGVLKFVPVINNDYTLTYIKIQIWSAPIGPVLLFNCISEETPRITGLIPIDIFSLDENRNRS